MHQLYELTPEAFTAILNQESIPLEDRLLMLAALSIYGTKFDYSLLDSISPNDMKTLLARKELVRSIVTDMDTVPAN